MWEDPIVEEVRHAREEHAAKFNYDIDAIFKDLKDKQKSHKKRIVSFIDGKYQLIEKKN
jgi:hypothetical protein